MPSDKRFPMQQIPAGYYGGNPVPLAVPGASKVVGPTKFPGGLAMDFDPTSWQPPPDARPIRIKSRFVLNVASPSSAQSATATELVKANQSITRVDSTADDAAVDWAGSFEGTAIVGRHQITPGCAVVVDKVGVTSFSMQSEYEIVWLLGAGGQGTAGRPTYTMSQPTRGWPYGSADNPGAIPANRVVWPTQGTAMFVGLFVRHTGSTTTAYGVWPHYLECVVQGWELSMGPDGLPVVRTSR